MQLTFPDWRKAGRGVPGQAPLVLVEGQMALMAHHAGDDARDVTPDLAEFIAQMELVAELYDRGCRRVLLVETGDDAGAAAVRDIAVLRLFNDILSSRGLERIALRTAGPGSKAARLLAGHAAEAERVFGRRDFLTRAANSGDAPGAETRLARVQALNPDVAGALFAVAPRIDPGACTGCDACLRVCPHDVLTQINDEIGQIAYKTRAASCDACGLCVDVCAVAAISLERMTVTPPEISLRQWSCGACGAAVHAPEQRGGGDDGLCITCRKTGHHKKLFQVLS